MTGGGGSIEDHAQALADAIDVALPGWVVRCVERVLRGEVPAHVHEAARAAGELARAETGADVKRLLACDIDEQRSTPLALVREAVRFPTGVLRSAGVSPVERDRFAIARFPADVYDLSPAKWSDVHPSLGDLGIAWGAAKAFEHNRRHRPAG